MTNTTKDPRKERELDPVQRSADQKIHAIGYFKDWTNILSVTTVAAMGWIISDSAVSGALRTSAIVTLTISIVFGIFTLALIPLITERISEDGKSIYKIHARFYVVGSKCPQRARLKDVCWIQHVSFLVGIVCYAVGAVI